jgi:lipoate-protein ligase A
MERDVQLLSEAEAGVPGARAYFWDDAWVSLGRFQRPERVFSGTVPELWVQRPTGGRAVQHGHDICLSVAVPLTAQDTIRSLRPIYERLTSPILAAFQSVGIDAVIANDDTGEDRGISADCFALRTGYDVTDRATGKKLGGCALRVTSQAALLQSSFPFGPMESEIQGYVGVFTPFDPAKVIEAFGIAVERVLSTELVGKTI